MTTDEIDLGGREKASAEAAALDADKLIAVKGEIIDLSKKFWREGWGFGKVKPRGADPIRITGILQGFQVGQLVSIVGKYHEGRYGVELRVETIVVEDPRDQRGIRQWLIDRIPQIGPKRAEEVARQFGDKIWEVLDTTPYLLTQVDGITAARVDEIVRAWNEHKKEREKYVPFYDLGLSHREAKAAAKAEVPVEEIVADPFVLYLRVSGISFARNDIIATRANSSRTAPSRLAAAAIQVVKDAAYDGHTGVDEEYIVEHAAALAGIPHSKAREGLGSAIRGEFLSVSEEDGMIMLPKYSKAEAGIAAKIEHLLNPEEAHGHDHPRPHAGGGGQDDAHAEGGHRDGRAGDWEEHDPSQLPGPFDGEARGAGGADWEGSEEDR